MRIRRHLGDLADAVFVALQVLHLLIEDLPGELARLLQHHAAVFRISVVAEIGAFVDEALAGGVDQDAERIGVLLELIADGEIAELRRIHFPLHGVAARPVAARRGADIDRHADAVAGVVSGCRAPSRDPSPGRDSACAIPDWPRSRRRPAPPIWRAIRAPRRSAARARPRRGCRRTTDRGRASNSGFRCRASSPTSVCMCDEARAAADGLDGEPAPELELAVDLERLPAVDRNEPHALLAHPVQRIEALGDQKLDQIGIGAVLRDARHVVEELIGGVGAEIRGFDFRGREVGHQRLDVVDAVIDDADRARGEAAVAAGLVLRRRLAHHDLGALLLRRQRRAKRRIAGADNNHIRNLIWHFSPYSL